MARIWPADVLGYSTGSGGPATKNGSKQTSIQLTAASCDAVEGGTQLRAVCGRRERPSAGPSLPSFARRTLC